MTKKIEKLEDLTPDSENFNKHTEFGSKLLEDSLRKSLATTLLFAV